MRAPFRLPNRLSTLFWAVMAFGTDVAITQSALDFLLALHPGVGRPPLLASAASDLVSVALCNWLFFSFFFRPGQRHWLPAADIRQKPGETERVMRAVLLVLGTSLTFRLAAARLDHISPYPDSYLWGIGLITLVAGAVELARWGWARRARAPSVAGLADFGLLHQAQKKIKTRLTPEEQMELAQLLYEARQLERTDLGRLIAGVLWGGLAVNFALVLLQTIIGRL